MLKADECLHPSHLLKRHAEAEEEHDVDPFDAGDDEFFKEARKQGTESSVLQDSPVTSPESKGTRPYSISMSSSQSSTASSGRAVLNSTSRRLKPIEGLGLLKRSMEVLCVSKDIRFVEHSIRTIRELMSCDFVNEGHLMGNGVVEAVCNLLKAHGSISSLAEEVCRFLALIFEWSQEAREIAGALDGVENIRVVMEAHFELYSSTVDAAMRALGSLCKHGRSVRTKVRETRSLEWILVCIRQWREVRSVQNSALSCLDSALTHEEESIQHAVSLGIFQELLYSMHRFEEDGSVQCRSIRLLNTLIASDEENTLMSESEGAIERVVHSLRFFPNKVELVAAAARACEYYSDIERSRTPLVQEGGVEAILHAIQQIVKRERDIGSSVHKRAISNCVLALGSAAGDASSRSLVCQLDNVALVATANSQYEGDVVVAKSVSKLFRSLSTEDSHKVGFGGFFAQSKMSTTVVEHIVRTEIGLLSANTENEKVCENACAALLSVCSQGRTTLVKKSCPSLQQIIQGVVENHSDHDVVINLAVSLVMQIR